MRLALTVLTGLVAMPAAALSAPRPLVSDDVGSLYESTQAELEAQLAALRADTGIELHVLLIAGLGGKTAQEVARSQPIWRRDGEQALLLVAVTERQVRIETEGPNGTRRDARWAEIIERAMLPSMRARREATAIRRGVAALDHEFRRQPVALPVQPRGSTDALRDTLFVLSAGLLAALSFDRMRRERLWRGRW